jgi:hypothetical protein
MANFEHFLCLLTACDHVAGLPFPSKEKLNSFYLFEVGNTFFLLHIQLVP